MDELVEALRLHAYDDCGEQDIPTHIANIAADRIESLTAQLAEAQKTNGLCARCGGAVIPSDFEAEVERIKNTIYDGGFEEGREAAAKVAEQSAISTDEISKDYPFESHEGRRFRARSHEAGIILSAIRALQPGDGVP